ncbi:MAG: alpha/beta hydrolase [Syntrophorhabdaceae bacterium]|nr:alpha/beta hydrolase [Syntrophorhabdaceae bacterium]
MMQNFILNTDYNRISGIISFPKGENKRYPLVILSHGLISSKESSKYIALADRLNEEGIGACRFDYHGCGESGGFIEETTLSIRVKNLEAVLEFVSGHPSVDPERIGVLGSSFGGSTCIIKAARDKRIKCVSIWATPYKLEERDNGTISDIKFKDTIFTDFQSYDILEEAEKVSHALVVHGDLDEVVPCTEGKEIYNRMRRPKKLEIIKGADHTFTNPLHRDKAITMAVNWFRRYLIRP